MKKNCLFLLAAAGLCLGGCNNNVVPPADSTITYQYGEDQMFEKLWETKVVHNESCVMIEKDGVRSANLVYTPTRIISVRNFTLQKEYDPSEYRIEGNRIIMTESSSMPFLTQANITCAEIPDTINNSYDDGKGGKILFTEGIGIVAHQIMVTYEHEDTWKGTIPAKKGAKLPKLQAKLAAKEKINFVVNGDSIFTGCNASGKLGIEPFLDAFPESFSSEITRHYGSEVALTNTAVGGMLSSWGKENVDTAVNTYNPDLVLIGFGMNDGSWNVHPLTYQENIDFMIRSIKSRNPNAEIIVAATILANPNSSQNRCQADYLPYLQELESDYEGVAVLDMTTYSKDLLAIKTSFELYANNINHPCDFMVRGYVANLMNLIEIGE